MVASAVMANRSQLEYWAKIRQNRNACQQSSTKWLLEIGGWWLLFSTWFAPVHSASQEKWTIKSNNNNKPYSRISTSNKNVWVRKSSKRTILMAPSKQDEWPLTIGLGDTLGKWRTWPHRRVSQKTSLHLKVCMSYCIKWNRETHRKMMENEWNVTW